MNKEFESKTLEAEEFKTPKFDFEEYDPRPLEPEDFEGLPPSLGGIKKKSIGEGSRLAESRTKKLTSERFESERSKSEELKSEELKSEGFRAEESEDERLDQGHIAGYRAVITALSLVGQIGLVMFACVAIGLLGGMFLDGWLGTEPIMLLIFMILGVISGFRTVYMMIKKLIK